MKLRLGTRISLLIVGMIVMLVVVLAGLLFLQFERTIAETRRSNTLALEKAVLDRVEKRAVGLATFMAESAANSMYHYRHDAMRDLSLTAAKQFGVVYVWVYDSAATIIIDGTEHLEDYGKVLSDPMVTETLATGATLKRVGNNILHVSVPAKVGSQILGGVKIGISLLDIQADIAAMADSLERADEEGRKGFLQVTGIAALIFVALGVGFSVLIARGISGPIEKLVDLTRRFAKGEFDADIPAVKARGVSEIAELDSALRAMARARKQAEAEARQLQGQTAHAARVAAVGEMATGLAHELNQPLTSIAAYVKGSIIRLRDRGDIPFDIVEAMESAATEAQRAGRIIHRIREFVQKKVVDREPRDLNLIVQESTALIRSDASWQGIAISIDLSDDLPLVLVDAIQIQQVVLNLLRNAMDAVASMPPARKRVRISTSRTPENWAQVAVSDWGEGLKAEIRASLFQPFVTTKAHGLGMGLSICRSIIEAHTGRLEVCGPDKPSTTFRFWLPPFED